LNLKFARSPALIAMLTVTASPVAQPAPWTGRLATLFQAQAACSNTDSNDCLPYLAEAVAVAQVLSEQVKLPGVGDKEDGYGIVFHDGYQERCTTNWLQSMNGPTLLRAALGLNVGVADAQRLYWVAALLQASQQLCHS
jgi:hypothetical protein